MDLPRFSWHFASRSNWGVVSRIRGGGGSSALGLESVPKARVAGGIPIAWGVNPVFYQHLRRCDRHTLTLSEIRNHATGLDSQAQDHVLEPSIAAPQGLPAWFRIALAAQEASQFGDRPDEVPRRPHPMAQPS